jgi:hypothetical protein
VALRLALAYPDLFRGALLDAGGDPIGTAQVPLPPGDLLHRFQQDSRIVFLTGSDDMVRQTQLAHTQTSLAQWCVFDPKSITLLHTGHVLADTTAIAQGLAALFEPHVPDATKIAACRARNVAALDRDLSHAEVLAHSGHVDQAMQSLTTIDARHGGLAAPRSIQLLRDINAQRAPHR